MSSLWAALGTAWNVTQVSKAMSLGRVVHIIADCCHLAVKNSQERRGPWENSRGIVSETVSIKIGQGKTLGRRTHHCYTEMCFSCSCHLKYSLESRLGKVGVFRENFALRLSYEARLSLLPPHNLFREPRPFPHCRASIPTFLRLSLSCFFFPILIASL